jgi:hypothetical protein
VRSSGNVLATAYVVEIGPVDLGEAIRYLSGSGPAGDARWSTMSARLGADPHSPLALCLRTPFMIWLMRAIYTNPATNPMDLFDQGRFADRDAIREHLIGAFLPAVYRLGPPAPDARALRRYRPDDARAWLAFLSRHLRRQATTDLAWWRLHEALSIRFKVAFGLLAALTANSWLILVFWLASGMSPSTSVSVLLLPVFVIAAGVTVAYRGAPAAPARVAIQLRGGARKRLWHITVGLAIGAGIGAPIGYFGGPALGLAFVAAGGIVGGFMSLVHTPDVVRAASSHGLLRVDRTALLAFLFVGGLLGGGVGCVAGATATSLPIWLVTLLAGGLTGGLVATLRFGRLGVLIGTLTGAAFGVCAGVLVGGQVSGLLVMATGGLAYGIGYGLLTSLKYVASPWFLLTRSWLAVRGALPWRLVPFLEDAHRRGVLRRMGAVYQLRHADLQDHLAGPSN